MPSSSPYGSLIRDLQKKSKTDKKLPQILKWREYYRKAGPVEFAEKELACPPDVPPHPEFGRTRFMILSGDEREFLDDHFNGQKLSIVSAGRGGGKTISLAIIVCWRITCFDGYEATCMGGSAHQSEIIQRYIDYWRLKNPKVRYCIPKSTGGVKPRIISRWSAMALFNPASVVSSRGPHVRLVIIDEVCSAEEKGEVGQKAVKDAWWQVIGKENTQLIMTSTAHFIFGTFYDYYTGKIGKDFKKYRWAIAKHISGIKDPYKTYKDSDPKNWLPNVWWVSDEDIKMLRKAKSDDEWLCEALGGLSIASGRMLRAEDLNFAICSLCDECSRDKVYKKECKIVEKYDIGLNAKKITERVSGIDWGRIGDPNAIVIIGRKGEILFILFAEELMSLVTEEMVTWANGHLTDWNIDTIYPDPQERALAQILDNIGEYAIIFIWEMLSGASRAKRELMINTKRFFEKKLIIIPKCFEELIHSLRQMSVGKDGKPRKRHDHSYDALSYALWEFRLDENLSDFWKVKKREIKDIW